MLIQGEYRDIQTVSEIEHRTVFFSIGELYPPLRNYVCRAENKETGNLMSFKEKAPKWKFFGVEGVQDMPAVKWKLANLSKMGGGQEEY